MMLRLLTALGFALLAASVAAQQQPALGRLFYTPAERAALENARRNKIKAEEIAAAAARKPRAAPARSLTVNGYVKRSDGESTVWINGAPVSERSSALHVAPSQQQKGSVTVRLPQKNRNVELKVGQRLEVSSGRIDESYVAKRSSRAQRQVGQAEEKQANTTSRRPRPPPDDEDAERDSSTAEEAPAEGASNTAVDSSEP